MVMNIWVLQKTRIYSQAGQLSASLEDCGPCSYNSSPNKGKYRKYDAKYEILSLILFIIFRDKKTEDALLRYN
jgi:hypothetical protein